MYVILRLPKKGNIHMINTDKHIITQVILKEGYELVQQKQVKDKIPKFTAIGKNEMDLIDIVMTLNTMEQRIISHIKNNIVYDVVKKEYCPIVGLRTSQLGETKTQKDAVTRAIKSLVTKNVIRKIKPNQYMINPDMLIPASYMKYKAIWDATEELETL